MAQAPKRKRLLPKNLTEKPDEEIAKKLFGKAAKEELDRLIDVPRKSIKQV